MNERLPPVTPQSGDIANVTIDPDAESRGASSTTASQQEAKFFEDSAAQYQLQHNQQNLGWLGKFCGSKSSAPTNAACFVIAGSFVLIALSIPMVDAAEAEGIREMMVAFAGAALAYLFGASSKE